MSELFEVRATLRHIPVSPQKARLVVNAVRGLDTETALNQLRYMPQKTAGLLYKLIESAVANAEQNFGLEASDLFVYRIFADDGPRHKARPYGGRFGSRGRFKPIINRSAHITVILAEREDSIGIAE